MSRQDIEACVRATLEQYFRDLHGAEPHRLQEMIMSAVEKPLLDTVMRHAEGNQSKAAQWLGINRNTLRRKLTEHNLDP
jgi:Fis family transcriptional regulator